MASPPQDPAPSTGPAFNGFNLAVDYAGPLAFVAGFFLTRQILLATWALVAGSVIALGACLIVRRRIAPLPALYGGAALLFGGLTLVFHDPSIVKMKTTVIDAALGAVMLGGLALGKSPIRLLMGEAVALSDKGWRQLTLRFGAFFLILAVANEVVWRTQPDATWVLFRMPGLLILTVVFAALQTPLILRETHRPAPDDSAPNP